jgi:hypothetical protein
MMIYLSGINSTKIWWFGIYLNHHNSTIFIEVVNNMKNEKELSPFLQKMKDAYLSRKENPEIIRPEDMRDEEYLRYTIRKKWREEGKGKEWLKNLEEEQEKQKKKTQST